MNFVYKFLASSNFSVMLPSQEENEITLQSFEKFTLYYSLYIIGYDLAADWKFIHSYTLRKYFYSLLKYSDK